MLALAARLLRAGRPGDAIAPLSKAGLLQPLNPIIQHDLGLACLEVGRVPDAVAAFRRAIPINPRYTDAYFRMGIALEKLGDLRGAILAYDRATELLPSLTEAWFRVGALVYILGYRDEAIGRFRRAAATGPKTSFDCTSSRCQDADSWRPSRPGPNLRFCASPVPSGNTMILQQNPRLD
jgi:tetratricopeptide (TPR) repeat protein